MTKRSRRALEKPGPAGFLLVDKPSGWTSHDVVDAARGWFGTRRVGHLGTLDPLATGVLPLAIRAATKLVPYVTDNRKSYVGSIEFGVETDTLDAEGQVLSRHEGALPERAAIERALAGFLGEIEQVPPMYSAVKRAGVPLHKLARAGKQVERAPKKVRIDRVELISYRAPIAELEVDCSPGTYVRTLADDLGRLLGCGAHLRNLRRRRSGPFALDAALPPDQLAEAAEAGKIERYLVPAADVLGLEVVQLGPEEARRVEHGGEVGAPARLVAGARVAALKPGGDLLAVMEVMPGRRLKPLRVLQSVAPAG
ncbi:MAG: tRNA pseudouridine(55) synthase TruB [Deltaproteobacteria bacterium]|jgi:tRNA pseudouridine55 synthase|nr:tRNA pseudouridine(55) synthase TruB [Deltaproteobacteria bacterium]MBW2541700.1 tRNA pseudouridine(55) synthase TruB [Deltaproteobacteria bacterium]